MTDDDERGDVPMEGMGMIRELPEIGRPGPPIDILFGGDVDPATGRLLSIAQLQAQLRARAGLPPGPPAAQPTGRVHPKYQPVDDAPLAGPLRWIAVLGAQPGAGCTVTALAMADGAAQLGRPVHLVAGGGYALTGVADRELGIVDGGWQRGRRGDVVLDHTAGYPVSDWPPIPSRPDAPVAVIIACRASVPGVICAERVLGDLSSKPGLLGTRKPGGSALNSSTQVVIAAVGKGLVYVGTWGVCAGLIEAAKELENAIISVGFDVPKMNYLTSDKILNVGPGQSTFEALTRDVTDAGAATMYGILSLFLFLPAGPLGMGVALTRMGALMILTVTLPISASGLINEFGARIFWRSARWFLAAVLIAPNVALLFVIGVQISGRISVGDGKDFLGSLGTAVVAGFIMLMAAYCPVALYRIFGWMEPGTAANSQMRSLIQDAKGGFGGLFGGGGGGGGGGDDRASQTSAGGGHKAAGEDDADGATGHRFGMAGAAAGKVAGAAKGAASAAAGKVAGSSHGSIASNVANLLAAAMRDGYPMCGSGYRDHQRQIELRRQHCGTSYYDIYRKSSSSCSPPTAVPGNSMHERGLAIDFTLSNDTGFDWLKAHSQEFGLKNLPSERWHYSTNGN